MTPITCFKGQTVALFGLGGSGLVSALALMQGGARVVAWDDNPASVEKALAQGVHTQDLHKLDWSVVAALILSPGVPLTHPEPHWTVFLARQAGVEIIGDVELFVRERCTNAPDAPFIAITGTNGKSTTTALVAHMLREMGSDVQMGGNIGTAVLSLEPPSLSRVHVVECSSFQIDLAPNLNPTVGIHLNVTPDHLDRHGTMENYAAIKGRLIAGADHAACSVDDEWSHEFVRKRRAENRPVTPVSVERSLDQGIYADGPRLVYAEDKTRRIIADLSSIGSLRGAHNAQNAAAACAALLAMGVPEEKLQNLLATFPGLAHRMEELGRIGRVLIVNDSKATNADSAAKALGSFQNIHWIVGGKAKEGGISSLASFFPRVTKAYLIGASSEDFAKVFEGRLPYEYCDTLDKAVPAAVRDAETWSEFNPVVLLSPACASFDQFRNFEVRGDYFKGLVKRLMDSEGGV